MATDIAIISCHYNFGRFAAPRANLHRFLRLMRYSSIPVYGVELYLSGQEPATLTYPGWHQYEIDDGAVLWQKEALLNSAEKLVPSRYQKIAWVDADVIPSSSDWIHALSKKLDQHPFVQPFDECFWTDRGGDVIAHKGSCFKHGLDRSWQGHPGFAMAARRSFFKVTGGIWDKSIIGNADTLLAAAVLYGDDPERTLSLFQGYDLGLRESTLRHEFSRWAQAVRAFSQLDGGSTYLPDYDIYHEWHGERLDRQYVSRLKLLNGFEPHEIERTKEGFYRWSGSANPERVKQVYQYFINRKEDG